MAGLSAAFFLGKHGHHVSLFERQPELGMGSHAVQFSVGGSSVSGDVPSRMFNDQLWPELSKLYQEADIKTENVEPTQSLSDHLRRTYLKFAEGFRPTISSVVFSGNKARHILKSLREFRKQAIQDLESSSTTLQLEFDEYLRKRQIDKTTIKQHLYPTLASTVCTCSYAALNRYPAGILLAALRDLTSAAPLMKTRHGTSDVVRRLSQHAFDIRCSTSAVDIARSQNGVSVVTRNAGETTRETFEHVIIATQANHAIELVDDLRPDESETLKQFEYENVEVSIHTDPSFMPKERSSWATFNMVNSPQLDSAMCTVWMNQFHSNWKPARPVFQTIMPIEKPRHEIQRITLQRPVVTSRSFDAWNRLKMINSENDRRIWFCGSYAHEGIPLLESAVASSKNVAKKIISLTSENLAPR